MKHLTTIQTFLKSAFRPLFVSILSSFLIFSLSTKSHAQATLSLQGIVKKSNGVALEDGEYQFTFKIYVVDSSDVKWFETIPNVEVISGIYNAIIGLTKPLDIPFNKDYEVGVSIGSQEMLPRIRLTSAPYAMSLRGENNQFPSSGQVMVDELKAADGIIASGGAPGNNNVNKNGYSFHNGGDNDGGLFSLQDGEVSLFTNATERIKVDATGATVNGAVDAYQLNLKSNGGITYTNSNNDSFQGWRLADVDDLATLDGWKQYGPVGSENIGWNSTIEDTNGICLCGPDSGQSNVFTGNFLRASNRNNVLKKQFTIAGTFTHIKVKFRYYAFDSWDSDDYGFAGFATNLNGENFRLGWYENFRHTLDKLNTTLFKNTVNFRSTTGTVYADQWREVEMNARANGNNFWVFIGAALEGDTDEFFGVGPIEIWVR